MKILNIAENVLYVMNQLSLMIWVIAGSVDVFSIGVIAAVGVTANTDAMIVAAKMIKFSGRRLQLARAAGGYTQVEFGKLLGMTGKNVCKLEKEIIQPTMPNFMKIIEVLKVSPNYLMAIDDHSELIKILNDKGE